MTVPSDVRIPSVIWNIIQHIVNNTVENRGLPWFIFCLLDNESSGTIKFYPKFANLHGKRRQGKFIRKNEDLYATDK